MCAPEGLPGWLLRLPGWSNVPYEAREEVREAQDANAASLPSDTASELTFLPTIFRYRPAPSWRLDSCNS